MLPSKTVQSSARHLRNVYFDFGKYNIKPENNTAIETAATFMKNNPKLRVKLTGHTDLIGSENRNFNLSRQRAQAVKDVMVKLGVDGSQIVTNGVGSTQPLASNDQEEDGRELNRRTEFTIIK